MIERLKAYLNAVTVAKRYVKDWPKLILLTLLDKRGIFTAKNGTKTELIEAKVILKALVRYDDRLRKMGYDSERFPLSFNGRLIEISVLNGFGKIRYDPSKLYSITVLPEQLLEAYDVDVMGKVVLDVGAYVGDSVLLWLWKGAKQVIAVEPVPEHFEALKETTKGFPVVTINAALGGPVPDLGAGYSGSGSYGLRRPRHVKAWLNVPVMRLMELVKQYGPDVVKLNCEGCEHAMLDVIKRHFKAAKREGAFAHRRTCPHKAAAKVVDAVFIPNGTDTRYFRPLPREEVISFKRDLGIGDDELLLLSVSHWYPRKRLDLLIRIVGYTPEQVRRKVHVFVAGYLNPKDPSMIKHYRGALEEARKHNVKFSRRFLSKEELVLAYNAADVYVHTSGSEGGPLAVIEAMACGKPVVMFDIGSAYPVHGRNAFVAKDVNEFAKYLEVLISDERLRHKMGQNALETSKMYDWNVITKMYLDVYRQALKGE